jgi:hypothetical protein
MLPDGKLQFMLDHPVPAPVPIPAPELVQDPEPAEAPEDPRAAYCHGAALLCVKHLLYGYQADMRRLLEFLIRTPPRPTAEVRPHHACKRMLFYSLADAPAGALLTFLRGLKGLIIKGTIMPTWVAFQGDCVGVHPALKTHAHELLALLSV